MPKRKTKARAAKRAQPKRGEIIDAEIVDVGADERPTAPPVVVEIVPTRAAPRAAVEAFGMQAVVADVKEAVAAGEAIGRMLRRLLR